MIAFSVPPDIGEVTSIDRAPATAAGSITNCAVIGFAVVADGLGIVTTIPLGMVLLAPSTKSTTEPGPKCVQPLPVIVAVIVVPAVPAFGETRLTADKGLLVVADPLRFATNGTPPGAESVIVNDPVSGPGAAVVLGANKTEIMHVDLAAMMPVGQLLEALKLPTVASEKVSDWVSLLVSVMFWGRLTVPSFCAGNVTDDAP